MWRNLRVSGKLSLGFGLIVLVFLVSVLVMWRSIATVRSASTTLAEGVAVASEQVNALNSQTYEMLMAMRLVQYEETPEAISEFRARLEQVLKIQADVEALHEARPALLAPIHVVNTVIPLSKEYAALVEQSLVAIGKKQDALASLRRDGQATTNTVSEFMTVLHGHMKDRIQNWAGAEELGALADAMSLGDTLMQDSMALRRDIWQFVAAFGRNAEVRQAVIDRVNNMRGQIEAIEPLVASFPEGKSKIDSLFANLASYESQVAEFVKFSDEVERFREARAPLMNSLNHENTVAADMATARVKEVSEENVEELGTALLVMSVSTAVAVVLGVFIVFFIARSISRPLNTIVGLAKRAGDGDLSIQKEDFGYDGRDEMGGMIVALSAMLESQRAAGAARVVAGTLQRVRVKAMQERKTYGLEFVRFGTAGTPEENLSIQMRLKRENSAWATPEQLRVVVIDGTIHVCALWDEVNGGPPTPPAKPPCSRRQPRRAASE